MKPLRHRDGEVPNPCTVSALGSAADAFAVRSTPFYPQSSAFDATAPKSHHDSRQNTAERVSPDPSTFPTLTREERAARITLRDPPRRNALDVASLATLASLIGAVGKDPSIEVLVIDGQGPTFCAGFDLAACAAEPRAATELLAGLSACVSALRMLDIPIVARVQGAALAGGCALLTGCDFVVAARDAQFGYPVHRLGISPAVSAPSLFSRMGPATRTLLMSNDLIDGATAVAIGLATHCVEAERLDAEVAALVARLLAKGPLALRETKRWIRSIEARMPGDLGATPPRDANALQRARDASVELAEGDEFATRVREFWAARAARAAAERTSGSTGA